MVRGVDNMNKEEKEFMSTCDLYLSEAGVKEEWQRIRQCGKLWGLVAKQNKYKNDSPYLSKCPRCGSSSIMHIQNH